MNFYDYTYYKIYWWNNKIVLNYKPFFTTIISISACESINLIFLSSTMQFLTNCPIQITIKEYYISSVIITTINYIYFYPKKRRKKINDNAKKLPLKRQKLFNLTILVYIVSSFVLLFISAYL